MQMTIDVQSRQRWRDYRGTLRMTEYATDDQDFASGGLASLVTASSVRVLVLPADPESTSLAFTDEVWALLPSRPPAPWGGQLSFFPTQVATSDAALIVERSGRDSAQPWSSYLGVHRNGAVETELGLHGGWTRMSQDNQPVRHFFLKTIVSWPWTGIDLHRRLLEVERSAPGPVEVSVALRDLAGSSLAELGAGWPEPHNTWADEIPIAVERHALVRYEVAEVMDPAVVKAAALEIGDRIDNCFGSHLHRHLDRVGEHVGEFVPARY
jgi:hypothetical protein